MGPMITQLTPTEILEVEVKEFTHISPYLIAVGVARKINMHSTSYIVFAYLSTDLSPGAFLSSSYSFSSAVPCSDQKFCNSASAQVVVIIYPCRSIYRITRGQRNVVVVVIVVFRFQHKGMEWTKRAFALVVCNLSLPLFLHSNDFVATITLGNDDGVEKLYCALTTSSSLALSIYLYLSLSGNSDLRFAKHFDQLTTDYFPTNAKWLFTN